MKNVEITVILSEAEGSYAAMQCSVLSQDPSASLRMTK